MMSSEFDGLVPKKMKLCPQPKTTIEEKITQQEYEKQ